MQLKMFLTRMGPTAKFIVTGDMTQIDLPKKNQSGLSTAVKLLEGIEGIDMIYLSGGDVVRHKLVKRNIRGIRRYLVIVCQLVSFAERDY